MVANWQPNIRFKYVQASFKLLIWLPKAKNAPSSIESTFYSVDKCTILKYSTVSLKEKYLFFNCTILESTGNTTFKQKKRACLLHFYSFSWLYCCTVICTSFLHLWNMGQTSRKNSAAITWKDLRSGEHTARRLRLHCARCLPHVRHALAETEREHTEQTGAALWKGRGVKSRTQVTGWKGGGSVCEIA